MSAPVTVRDEMLGAALRELQVPEHRPEFHARLHYLLAEERALRLVETRRRTRARQRRVAWTVRLAAVAAIVSAAGVIGFPRTQSGPERATAAEVKAKVAAALASAQSVSGELVVSGASYQNAYGWERRRWLFALTARGDLRLTHTGGDYDLAYDASEDVERSLGSFAGDSTGAVERRGVAPGPPDRGPSGGILWRDFGGVVRALLAAGDPRVSETTYEGRAAWELDIGVSPNAIVPALSGDRFEITVDRETGFPLSVIEKKGGEFLDALRIENVRIDPDLGSDEFRIEFQNAHVQRSDDGFRRVGLDEVARVVGYPPLVPARVPDGFELAEVAVAEEAPQTGVEGGNPRSRNVVSLSYRRGLDQFIVTTRLRHVDGYPDEWSDPLGTGEGFRDEPENITLEGGALTGLSADLLIVPRNVPHLWTLNDQLVVTVSGDLTREELISVAESLGSDA